MKSKPKPLFFPLFSQGQPLHWPFLLDDANLCLDRFKSSVFDSADLSNRLKKELSFLLPEEIDDNVNYPCFFSSEKFRTLLLNSSFKWTEKPILDLLKAVQDPEYQTGQERVEEALFRFIRNFSSQPTSTIDPVNNPLVPDSEVKRVGIDRETFVNLLPEEIFVKFIETTGSFEILLLSALIKSWEKEDFSYEIFKNLIFLFASPETTDSIYAVLAPHKGFFMNFFSIQSVYFSIMFSFQLASLGRQVFNNNENMEKIFKDNGLYFRRLLYFTPISEEEARRKAESCFQTKSFEPLCNLFQ